MIHNDVSHIYITSMGVDWERNLTQEEISSIISLLQSIPYIGLYDSLGNPPTGGNYFNLVAYKADENVLRMAFNGEWILFQIGNDDRACVFNGENSGLEAIREIIAD